MPTDSGASLRECGCAYELVEDGAVQRKRWFHEPGCMTTWERLERVVAGEALLSNPEATIVRDYILALEARVERLESISDFFIPPEADRGK